MRILTLSDVYFPRINGVSTSILTFHRAFRALGHEPHLIAPRYSDEEDTPEVTRISGRQVLFDPEDRMIRRRHLLDREEELSRGGYDVVHIQTPFVAHVAGVELARRLGLPVVETYHTYFEEYLFHYVPLLPKAVMRAVARRMSRRQCDQVDAVVVPSTAMADALGRYGVTTPVTRIPTGLRLEEFAGGDGAAFRHRLGIAPERPLLLHVGRVAFEKNIGFLLSMLRHVRAAVPDVLLVIAGEGPAERQLRRQAAWFGLHDHVRFVGYLARDGELLDCYRAADAFVFASRTETQGLVLLEAMALGVPVVSTAEMGTVDVVGRGRGARVSPEDEHVFAGHVVELLGDAGLRRRLGEEARRYAAEWNAEAMARRLLSLYRELLERRPARAA